MGLYYNRTQSPVPVTLSGGRSILIAAKGRESLHGEDESAPALLQAISAQKIVRLPDAYAAKSDATAVAAPHAALVVAEPSAPSETALEMIAATSAAGAPETEASAPESTEIQNETTPSDDGSGSGVAASAAPAEQSRADGPRRERRK